MAAEAKKKEEDEKDDSPFRDLFRHIQSKRTPVEKGNKADQEAILGPKKSGKRTVQSINTLVIDRLYCLYTNADSL